MFGSSNFNVKKIGAFSAVLAIMLSSCGGSSTSSNAGRAKNTKLADGTICYTPEERSGLVAAAEDVEYQAAIAFQPAVSYQPAVLAQPAVEAQAAIAEEIATQDYEAVAPQPEIAYRAGVPAQPAVPAVSERVLSVNEGWYMPYSWSTYVGWNSPGSSGHDTYGGYVISSVELMHNGSQLLRLLPATSGQPEVAAIAEVKYQAAVSGRPAIKKGDVLQEAISGRSAQDAVAERAEVLAQGAVMATDEVQAKTKDEVIAEINAVKECPADVVAVAAAAEPSLGDVTYDGMTASISLIVPDGVSTEGWKIGVSWPRRGNHTDTGASNRMRPGDLSAAFDLRPNSNGSNCDRETGEFTLLYNDVAIDAATFSYDDAVGGPAPECGGSVTFASAAEPTLSEVTYEGLKASVNLVVPDGASAEGWTIAVSWPRRGNSTDTGARSRLYPGDLSASIDLLPNSNGSNCDREIGEFTLLYNDEEREIVGYSYDDAVGGVDPDCGGSAIESAYFSNLSYSEDMNTAYIEVMNPPSTTWGVGHGLCEDGVLTKSSLTAYAISGIANCPDGYLVLFDGDQAIDQAVFGIIPSTPQLDHEYSIDVVTSEDGVVGTLLVDGEPCPTEQVEGNPCEDVGVSYSVDYAYWEFDGKGLCDAFIKHCIQQSFSNLRGGTKGFFVASYLSVPTCPCVNVSEMYPFEIKGKSDVTVTTVANPVLPVVSLTDLLLVKDVIMSQVVPVDLSEVICLAECVTDLQTSAGVTGDVFVQVDNGDFIEVRAGSRIALGDSSSAVKIQIRPRDGSTPVDMVVNLNRSTNGLEASDGSSSNIPWIPIGLLVIVLIALYVIKTYVLDKRKVNS